MELRSLSLSLPNLLRKRIKLGYTLVMNPGAKDHQDGVVSNETARRKETEYFSSHSYWSQVDKSCLGTHALTVRLSEVLVDRIQNQLPEMASEVEKQLVDAKAALELLGKAPPTTDEGKRETFSELLYLLAEEVFK